MAGIRTCRDQHFAALRILVIPSNHDPDLAQGDIAAENVEVIAEPQLLALDRQRPGALRIPYKSQETMGEHISPLSGSLEDGRWVMIGHGDWDEGVRAPNPYEPGVYMPLTRKDLAAYKPGKVLLGHTHLSLDLELVHCPGSPYPADITRTGPRRSLLLETENYSASRRADARPSVSVRANHPPNAIRAAPAGPAVAV